MRVMFGLTCLKKINDELPLFAIAARAVFPEGVEAAFADRKEKDKAKNRASR